MFALQSKIRNFAAAGCVASATLMASGAAHAIFIVSDVSYTANSVTFTIDGDMTGYTTPNLATQFSLDFQGDIWAGPVSGSGYTPNIWSASVFDNRSISQTGNLYHKASDTNPYSWTRFNTNLAGAIANLRTVTVSWSQNWLNTSAANPIIAFLWGNGNDAFGSPATLATINVNDAPAVNEVPEPSTLGLSAIGLAGLGFLSRRRRKQSNS